MPENNSTTVKFQNKYRIPSARLRGCDYSQNGAYFITICTHNHEHAFGEIKNGVMVLSDVGKIVESEWRNTETIRWNVKLDEFVVMPNHIHGIIVIDNDDVVDTAVVDTAIVETHCNASLRPSRPSQLPMPLRSPNDDTRELYKNKFGPQSNNLSAIIRGFKGATTKQIHVSGSANFQWQTRFHDHVIRNEKELNRIRAYIQNNPANWEADSNNQ